MLTKNKNMIRSCMLGIIAALGLCLLLWLGYRAVIITPYERFRKQEVVAELALAQLNEDTFAQIPPPQGVVEEERYPINGPFYHGTALRIEYLTADITPSDVLSYYEQLLLPVGWIRYDRPMGERTLYYRETSCVQIVVFADFYYLSIYHDFRNQEFSPKMPPLWLISLHEFGETSIDQCPPDSDP